MLSAEVVVHQTAIYLLKLMALLERYDAGERTAVATEAQADADALICLMEDAPPEHREAIDYLIDRYEALRASSVQ
jgi:hypothetical protein